MELNTLFKHLNTRSRSEGRQITIAYGSSAGQATLAKIAPPRAAGAYAGDPMEIQKVYLQISSSVRGPVGRVPAV